MSAYLATHCQLLIISCSVQNKQVQQTEYNMRFTFQVDMLLFSGYFPPFGRRGLGEGVQKNMFLIEKIYDNSGGCCKF